MKKLTVSMKKKITRDWAELYPTLGVYRALHLLRRAGPLLMGICLERDSSNSTYRPTFHVHNLCFENTTITLALDQPLLTLRTAAPDTIEARWHDEKYREAAERLRAQAPLPFSGDLFLDDVLRAYRAFIDRAWDSEHNRLDMVSLATWVGRTGLAENLIQETMRIAPDWPPPTLDRIGGVQAFHTKLVRVASDREGLLRTCIEQVHHLHLNDLPTAALLP